MMEKAEDLVSQHTGGAQRLKQKNIIVTAATRGIGLASALRCLQEGANVVICSRKEKVVTEVVKTINEGKTPGFPRLQPSQIFTGVACNVGDDDQLKQFIDFAVSKFPGGKIDGIVSNVGVNPVVGSALDLTDAVYSKIFGSNVRSHWMLIKLAREHINANASIIFISSVAGLSPSFPLGLYGASKTALLGLSRSLASELSAPSNGRIRVNTICPGIIKTKLSQLLWDGDAGQEAAEKVMLQKHGVPHEVGGVVAFLLSEDSSFITGEAIVCSGGSHARM